MNAAYYDANYLFKLQCIESGTPEVRAHAATVQILYSALHARAEFTSVAFRKVREGTASAADFRLFLRQMHTDAATGNLRFLPLTDAIIDRIETVLVSAPSTTYLRAADALHLIAAAPLFGLRGVNVIP